MRHVTVLETWALLMTDVEESTRRWQDEPAAMDAAMRLHHQLLHDVIVAHEGWRPRDQGEGDGVLAAFAAVSSALAAAAEAQRALSRADWPTESALRVRMAVHVGEVRARDGNLHGEAVNRCARIRGLAAGGQVLVSQQVALLMSGPTPAGTTLRPLGVHRLKDLGRPESLLQLDVAGLPTHFPPLPSLDVVRHNLPVQPGPLIGRERQLSAVRELLAGHRLVTLTGPGGIGKTRLALHAAAEAAASAQHPDVWFVDVSAVHDAAQVPTRVAEAAGLRAGDQPVDALRAAFAARPTLLVLDNLEQVLDCAAVVADLLADVPTLRVLATSRQPLKVRAERQLPVPPLELPDAAAAPSLEQVLSSDAVQLFVERAQAVRPEFEVTEDAAAAVARVAVRLEGHPLSLELAAARLRTLDPAALLTRLDRALGVLTGGGRDMPERHRTLRATIAWSVDALPDPERLLLSRLSVLPAPADLATVEAVAGDFGLDSVLDLLDGLVDRSLVRAVPDVHGRTLFTLMQSVREFAGEALSQQESRAALRRLAEWYALHLPRLSNQDRRSAVGRDLEHLRACLESSAVSGEDQTYVRLVVALEDALMLNGQATEAVQHLERARVLARDVVAQVSLLGSLIGARLVTGRPMEAVTAATEARMLARSPAVPARLHAMILALSVPCAPSRQELQQVVREFEELRGAHPGADPDFMAAELTSNEAMQLRYADPDGALALVADWESAPVEWKGVYAYRAVCVLLDRGRAREALEILDRVGDRVELVLNAPAWLTNLQTARATALLLLSDLDAAERVARQCSEMLMDYGISLARVKPVLAEVLRRRQGPAAAAEVLGTTAAGPPATVLDAALVWRRAFCQWELGDRAAAQIGLREALLVLERDEFRGPLELLGCLAATALVVEGDQPELAAELLGEVGARRGSWLLPFGLDDDLAMRGGRLPRAPRAQLEPPRQSL